MESKKTILVTGGTGYIGSHTVVELIQQGYEVIIWDNLSRSDESVLNSIKEITGTRPQFTQVDLCNDNEVSDALDEIGKGNIDAIIHFAAFKAVGESVQDPLLYFHNNLFSTVNLLRGMVNYNIENIVFSSSCTVYGDAKELPVNERTEIQKGASPYGTTKIFSEQIIQDSVKANHLKAISLRYFNPIGAHETALIGETPKGIPNNLVPFITQTAIGIRKELKVFGGDYNTSDGTCVRDYINVVDIAKAHISAVQRLISDKTKDNFEVFNLGTGKGNTVLEVIKAFEKTSGVKLNYKITDRRPGDVEQIYADTTLANQELGWKAERSLEESVYSAWKWEQRLKEQKQQQTNKA